MPYCHYFTFTKVSIIPRGMAGGYTLTPPTEDKHYLNKKELLGQMTVLLGGLVGEELHVGDTSTGVSNDLERVTKIARSMVCVYGMSEEMGTVAYGQHEGQRFLGRDLMESKDYSEATAKKIDEEVRKLINQAFERARKLLSDHRKELDLLAQYLLEKEVADIDESRVLLGIPKEPVESGSEQSDNPSEKTIDDKTKTNDSDDNSVKDQ